MKDILTANDAITNNSKQLEILKTHFPQCFDKTGAFIPAKLQEIVEASGVALSKEGYSLNWLGKSYARLLANENVRTLLKANTWHNNLPENLNSQNMLIKGDNLEVLKHLMGAYAGKVKMIYIDPPYNTGSDGFVYQDDRKFTVEQLSHLAGIDEDEARRILEFTSSDSNSHSAWLTFMYPRLYLAKQLLRDDGVIFISIDDNEQAQLKLLCDEEVFGENNFVTTLHLQMSSVQGQKVSAAKSGNIVKNAEYVLVYCKTSQKNIVKNILFDASEYDTHYSLYLTPTAESGIFTEVPLTDFIMSCAKSKEIAERFGLIKNNSITIKNIAFLYLISEDFREFIHDNAHNIASDDKTSALSLPSTLKLKKGEVVKYDTDSRSYFLTINSNNNVRQRMLLSEKVKQANDFLETYGVTTIRGDWWSEFHKDMGNVSKEGDVTFPNGKKPIRLIKQIVYMLGLKDGETVLDFFAGSGTTAHAVMQLNAEDGGNRQFICVQIDEPTYTIDEKTGVKKAKKGSEEAFKAGYETIYDITAERIKRAAVKIKEAHPEAQCDFGFKQFETTPVFEGYLDEPDELTPELELFNANKLSAEERQILMLTWQAQDGIALNTNLTPLNLAGYTAYQGGRLVYFIEPDLTLDAIVAFLERLDNDAAFIPNQLVVLGYLLDSKTQREMTEAVKQYNNRKGIELTLDVRF